MAKPQHSPFSSATKFAARKKKRSSVDWTNLPRELLDVILEKLVHLSDYIRFGAVCKSWHSVAIDQKQRRIATMHKQPPMLLFTHRKEPEFTNFSIMDGCYKHDVTKLYSISEGKVYRNSELYNLEPAHDVVMYIGSSYGWLVIQGPEEKNSSSIRLFNPFTTKSIQMPGINIDRARIKKVILSCDPSKCPNDLVLATLYYDPFLQLAFIRAGEKSWTFVDADGIVPGKFDDIIFHKGLLYASTGCGSQLFTIDYRNFNHDDRSATSIVKIVPQQSPDWNTPWRYLVEASNGDLLFVQRELPIAPGCMYYRIPGKFKVYKLKTRETTPSAHEQKVEWVEIHELENNDTIFVADNAALCIPAASCHPNSIYFTQTFVVRKCQRYLSPKQDCNDVGLGVFHIGNGTLSTLDDLTCPQNHILPEAWIAPTLC